jgi:hypothetical protein
MTPSVIKLPWSSCRRHLKQESLVLNCLPDGEAYAADVSTSYALYKQRNRFIIEALDNPTFRCIQRIRPEDYFCKVDDGTRCMVQVNWQPYYYDSNHLASAGARPIAQEIGQLSATLAAPSKQ